MKKGIVYINGINDADYNVKPTVLINGKYVITKECPAYATWKDLLRRCYSVPFREKNSHYKNVTMCSTWHRFSVFKYWFDSQCDGNYYDIDGNKLRLDKDLLYPSNKHYSPDNCVLVSLRVNSFILCGGYRTYHELPKGVSFNKECRALEVFCKDPFNRFSKYIGRVSSVEEGVKLYLNTKLSYLKDLNTSGYLGDDLYNTVVLHISNSSYDEQQEKLKCLLK
jgi:hypothetical protein